MEARELMVGDYIINTEFEKNEVDTIEIVEPTRVWLTHGKTYIPIGDIEPIPLTPEILEKNGFLNDGVSFWYLDFRIVLSTSKGVSLVCGRQKRFKFVHELQHAMRLCEIEKEIVI